LFDSSNAVIVAPPNGLLFVRGDTLVAQQFDFATLTPVADSRPVPNGILRTAAGRVAASASAAGVLVYAHGNAETMTLGSSRWVDRSGHPLDLPSIPGGVGWVRLSTDGRYVAYSVWSPSGTSEIWLYDLVRQIPTRLSTTTIAALGAVFSPDATRVAYLRDDANGFALLEQSLSGAGSAGVLTKSAFTETFTPNDWAPDGRTILVSSNRAGHRGPYLLSAAGKSALEPFIVGIANRMHGAVSPDGRWVAYSSEENGQPPVFVQSFPDPSRAKWTVSKPGAQFPRWRRDGRELFFAEQGGRIHSVSVTNGDQLKFGQPALLLEAPSMVVASGLGQPYDVSPDGQRFLVVEPRVDTAIPITVVVNWDQKIPS
jgi:Tol biopolymer transport system component